jgi:hypothetical protein
MARTTNRKSSVGRPLALLAIALLCPVGSSQAAQWGFTVYKRNMAMDPASGNIIGVTGAGLFNDVTAAVSGHGSYDISNAAGQVAESGTWVATEFVDFESQGGLNRGAQGGVLNITITLLPNGGSPVTDVPMTVICPFNAVTGFDEADDATLVGPFTEKVGDGETVFQLIRP